MPLSNEILNTGKISVSMASSRQRSVPIWASPPDAVQEPTESGNCKDKPPPSTVQEREIVRLTREQ